MRTWTVVTGVLFGLLPLVAQAEPQPPTSIAYSSRDMQYIASEFFRQVRDCRSVSPGLPVGLPWTAKGSTTVRVELDLDGSVVGNPVVVKREGVDAADPAKAHQHAEMTRKAVLDCQPYSFPPHLYDIWKVIDFTEG